MLPDYTRKTIRANRLKSSAFAAALTVVCLILSGSEAGAQESAPEHWNSPDSSTAAHVRRRPFWDVDLRGLDGFYPASYNRVDGLMAAWGFRLRAKQEIIYPDVRVSQIVADRERPEISFSLLVPSARRFVGGQCSLKQTLAPGERLDAGLNVYSVSENSDSWRSSEPGTSLTYLLTGRDRRYYYDMRGGDIYFRKGLAWGMNFQAGYFTHRIRSLGPRSVWTLAKSSLPLTNPPVTDGTENGLDFILGLDRLSQAAYFQEGWEFELSVEHGGDFLGGNFDYSLWSFSTLRATRFGGGHNYAFAELIGKTSSGKLPSHKLLSLGRLVKGLETFDRNFNLFDPRGNRLWFISGGYSRIIPIRPRLAARFIDDFSLEGVLDAGDTFSADNTEGALSIFGRGLGKLESSVSLGIGFTISRTRVGVYYTRSLNPDYSGSPFLVHFSSLRR